MNTPLTPLPKESNDAFLALTIYCYLPKPDRVLKTAWRHYCQLKNPDKPAPEKIGSKFLDWSQCFDWQARAGLFDEWLLRQAIVIDKDVIDGRIRQISDLLSFRDEFDTFFRGNSNISKKLYSQIDKLVLDVDKSKSIYEKIALLKDVSVIFKNLATTGKINFESWAVLLGIESILEQYSDNSKN